MFDFAFMISILPDLMEGLKVTIFATIGGYVLALALGFLIACGNRAKSGIIRAFCKVYVAFFRCTPLLVQLYAAYYVLPRFGISFSAITTGILALGFYTAAYLSEVIRAGIDAIPRGQWEAADALGLHTLLKWRKVLVPQLLPLILPTLGNYLIGMFKETPLLAAITVLDVFGVANDIAGQSYRYTEPYTAAAIILLIISLGAAYLLRRVEHHYSLERRQRR